MLNKRIISISLANGKVELPFTFLIFLLRRVFLPTVLWSTGLFLTDLLISLYLFIILTLGPLIFYTRYVLESSGSF